MGGYTTFGYLADYEGSLFDTVEVYDPTTNTWEVVANLHVERIGFELAVHENQIYVFGGESEAGNVNTAEMYNPETNTWIELNDMSGIRGEPHVEVYNDEIYVIGRSTKGNQTVFNIEKYMIKEDNWTEVVSFDQERYSFQTELLNGKAYVIGGLKEDQVGEKFNMY
ncbi:Kelch repeat-containing protein [Chengkuizengella axinellae]|uniref:Kelch repeat-containing protein n=1 Tax=Chengkuizengella axinellae TaxID=3064388 RepID=A0ABT9IWA5_9BACL|nr:kelch repeat-containing protein [Chengkuizengella sp. 2205SS18-9]MDP5273631.1 kelch repeat-containing protein [Chengkuizengella sp. 2205SS18-9]